MDNLTHTIIGLVAGEVAARLRPSDPNDLSAVPRRNTLLAMGMVGGNLPDVDLLWSMGTSGDRLGYLLHHRGYTHTVLGCMALAALLYVAALIWGHLRKQRASTRDRLQLAGFALLAVLLHLGMDSLNNYGVHPFWPSNNHWYYGDSLFIVEPLYWIAAAPLFFGLRTLTARALLGLVIAIASVAILFVNAFAWQWLGVPLAAALLLMMSRRWLPSRASVASAALVVVVTLTFITAGVVASRRVEQAGRRFAGFQTLDHVLTPSPAQPFCWDVLLLQRRDDQYVVRRGRLNLVGSFSCPSVLAGAGTAPLRSERDAAAQLAPDGLRWTDEFAMSRARLVELAQGSCAARELMQFARAPYVAETRAGWVLGDLRFDRERGLGLAEILVGQARDLVCRSRAPWMPPRADLLGANFPLAGSR